PMEFTFFEDDVDFMYREEQRTGKILGYSTGMSLFIACLGLFGLAAYSIAQRKKEIGIRKVLGAPIRSILLLLSSDITKLILIANLIACPIAFFLARDWIRNFAYRIPMSIWIFICAVATSFLIALITIGYQSLKAAMTNPAHEIHHE
ncbi:ABC transporter permease, partial [Acidobacteriota bacterium]